MLEPPFQHNTYGWSFEFLSDPFTDTRSDVRQSIFQPKAHPKLTVRPISTGLSFASQ